MCLCDCCTDYLEKLHRRGNKLILVHSIELPELSLHNASKSFLLLRVKVSVMCLLLLLWCHAVVDNVGDHSMPEHFVL